jgi:hypothetical protein
MQLKQDRPWSRGTRKGVPSNALCDTAQAWTRASSQRQLPTDHDHAARPANISVINRRASHLDSGLSCFSVGGDD